MALPEGFGKERKSGFRLLIDDAEIPLTAWARESSEELCLDMPVALRHVFVAETASKDAETIVVEKPSPENALKAGQYAVVVETGEMVAVVAVPSENTITIKRFNADVSEAIPEGSEILAVGMFLD